MVVRTVWSFAQKEIKMSIQSFLYKEKIRLYFLILVILTLLFISACTEPDPTFLGIPPYEVAKTTVSGVTMDPPTASIARGNSLCFTATVNGTNDPPQTVTWAVTSGITGTTINTSSGLLTVANDETNTTLTIRATSTYDNTKFGVATVTVVDQIPIVTSVVVSPPTVTINRGGTTQFTATVNGTNSPPQTVDWTVTGGITGTSISSSGRLTVANDETNTTLTVRATSTYDGTVSGTATVTVLIPVVTSVTVSPATVTIAKCQALIFTATVNGYTSQQVTWTVTGGISTIGVNSGLLQVAYNETATTLTVRATSVVDNTKSGTATVTVAPIATGPAGGYIFYDKGSYSNGWRYLEAAPASSEFEAPWGLNGVAVPGTNTGVGAGQANTTAIITILLANSQYNKAAQLCADMNVNGFSDWFLPSKDELNLMYVRLRQNGNIGGFNISEDYFPYSRYWSSSVAGTSTEALEQFTWFQRFNDGYQSFPPPGSLGGRANSYFIRAIRAF